MPWFRRFTPVGIGILMALGSAPARAAEGSTGAGASLSALPASAAYGRRLLRTGQLDQAERLVRGSLAAGADDSLLCLSGEIQFRKANFPEAGRAFGAALALNPENARAYWGLGRIEQAHFRAESARNLFAKAFSLDHRDTDIILAYADFVADPESKSILLDNVVLLARSDQPERAERAVAQRLIDSRLQGRAASRLVSPYTSYRLPLTGFRPNSAAQNGVLVSARINGGKTLRLLLDTGARGIAIDARAAKDLNLETIVASQLAGFGDTRASQARLALARSVAFGDLVFEDCLVEVSERSLTRGADGVVGADIFENFKIGLDARAGVLQLTPFEAPGDGAQNVEHPSVGAIGMRHLLFVKARVEGGKEGLFLVDTGAAFTAIAPEYLPPGAQAGGAVNMAGAQGSLGGATRVGPLALRLGGVPLAEHTPLAMDLRPISQLEGVEIAGILGYSVLGQVPFTLDLRHGVVEFARASSR